MNLFGLFGQLPASNSPQFTLNALDWKKIGREIGMVGLTIAAEELPKLMGYHYVFGGKDYTTTVLAVVWFTLQVVRRTIAGQKGN